MKIIVAGGAGFIGSHLCDRLIREGHEVWCIDNLQTGLMDNLAELNTHPKFHFIHLNICDELPDIEADQFYNLACPAAPRHYQADPIGTLRTCVVGTLNVLEFCNQRDIPMLQASTSEVYGDPAVHPQHEKYLGAVNCTGPRACYDEGKRAGETACFDYNREFGTKIRVARIFNTYGPRMSVDDGRVVPNLVTQALTGKDMTIYGSGSQTRSFCFVDDTVDGLMRLMNAEEFCVGPVNIGNDEEFSIRELAEIIVAKTKCVSSVSYKDLPKDDPHVRRPDITVARQLLGWQPTIKLNEGLDTTIAWYRERFDRQVSVRAKDDSDSRETVAIIGGGPAGLTAGYWMQQHSKQHHVIVLEASDKVGGIARTETYKGYRFDIGGHRFFTNVKAVENLWREVLPNDFTNRPRQSRIYYQGKFFSYPLKIFNALHNMGMYESFRILLSYMKWNFMPHKEEENFEQWVTNRFGGRLFWFFFRTYTEKVWGMPSTSIRSDWAVQRIKNMSLRKAVWDALTGSKDDAEMIETFDYPRLGPGMVWEAFRDRIRDNGGEIWMNSNAMRVYREGDVVTALEVESPTQSGETLVTRLEADHFISSMPISDLVLSMVPPAPPSIQAAAKKLRYREFIVVALILDEQKMFPDNWIYIHSPDVKVGRIQNFRSWSEDMVPDASKSSVGMEYFCQEGDELWNMDDDALIKLASEEIESLGLAKASAVVDGTVIRQEKAYPIYDDHYREALSMIRGWLSDIKNIQVVGRNGMHRYNNQDHSMMTAMLAVDNILGGNSDLWSVDVDQDYNEDIESSANISDQPRGGAHIPAIDQHTKVA
ncbi:MAG: GDP-mannose 4,6-dehydratase [Sphingobium sp.]|nr:GDP-mannose 4,6-dehydratase [Sphingomonas sp.]